MTHITYFSNDISILKTNGKCFFAFWLVLSPIQTNYFIQFCWKHQTVHDFSRIFGLRCTRFLSLLRMRGQTSKRASRRPIEGARLGLEKGGEKWRGGSEKEEEVERKEKKKRKEKKRNAWPLPTAPYFAPFCSFVFFTCFFRNASYPGYRMFILSLNAWIETPEKYWTPAQNVRYDRVGVVNRDKYSSFCFLPQPRVLRALYARFFEFACVEK